jgi:Nucleotidyltransferase of unknown function (DUF6036)
MKKNIMQQAFEALDRALPDRAELLIGGGAAMLLAHGVPLSTMDIDGILLASAMTPAELDPIVKKVGREMGIGAHWFNDYINTFTYTIPKDFRSRLVSVYRGDRLVVWALGKEDLLIMKCFSRREKDVGHARALLTRGADTGLVEAQIEALRAKGLPGAAEALEFLEELRDELEG